MQEGAVQMAGKVDSLFCPPHNADLGLMPFITRIFKMYLLENQVTTAK